MFLYWEHEKTLQRRLTYIILRRKACIMQYFSFSRVTRTCITQQKQGALYKPIGSYSPGYYCAFSPNRGDSESVACNCCSCSWCCLWLINELADQRENPWSHWKFRPISLLYPPKVLSLYSSVQHSRNRKEKKSTTGKTKQQQKICAVTVNA